MKFAFRLRAVLTSLTGIILIEAAQQFQIYNEFVTENPTNPEPTASQTSSSAQSPIEIEKSSNRIIKVPPQLEDRLPSCVNVTLTGNEFVRRMDNKSLAINVGARSLTLDNFMLSDDNTTANVCYPLSPQLLTCAKQTFRERHSALPVTFRINGHSLRLEGGDLELELGDYFFGTDGTVVWCAERIQPRVARMPRCNYIGLRPDEFARFGNGSWSLRTSGQIIIDRPEIQSTKSNRMANFCIPLDIRFVNCDQLEELYPTEYRIERNHSLYLLDPLVNVDIHNFFLSDDGMANVCASNRYWVSVHTVANNFYIGCYSMSAFCLSVTALTQFFGTPHLTYHARSLLHHVVTLIPGNLGHAINNWVPLPPLNLSPVQCYALFVSIYLSYMWAFFWLNALAFDVFYTFLELPTTRCRCFFTVSDFRRFVFYNIYAWTLPLFLCLTMLVYDQNRSAGTGRWVFPDVTNYCWFHDRRSEWIFYYVPLILIMSANLVFFVCTVCQLKFSSRRTELTKNKRQMHRFVICLKLFIVMGLAWVLDIIIFGIGDIAGYHVWFVSEGFTSLQGIAIFLVYVCKRENFVKCRKLFTISTPNKPKFTKNLSMANGHDVVSMTTSQ